jgi:hypothetical protein
MRRINVVILLDVEYRGQVYRRGERRALPAPLAMYFLKMGWAYEHKMLEGPERRKAWRY